MSDVKAYSLSWFRVDCDLVDHPKVEALAARLGDPNAGWYVIRLWSWTMRYASRGNLTTVARPSIEPACRWRGTVGELISAMIEVGLLEDHGVDGLEVHDWAHHQGAAVAKAQKDAERQQAARDSRKTVAGKSTDGLKVGAGTRRDETRRDETNKESTPAPEVEELRVLWNTTTHPPIPRWDKGREKAAKAALKRRSLKEWGDIFKLIQASAFCRGEKGGWKADIDWALRPEGKKAEPAAKLLEGSYSDSETQRGVAQPGDFTGLVDSVSEGL